MSESSQDAANRPAVERAGETVDRVGERVGEWSALLAQRLQVWAARAREEAEDIWAEAQSVRNHDVP